MTRSEEDMLTQKGRAGPSDAPPEWNRISESVLAAAFEVHSRLGPGLLERLYEQALVYELQQRGLRVARQVPIRIRYKEIELSGQTLDVVVEDLLIVERKSVERVPDVHLATLVSYLRASGLPLGLLINFNVPSLKQGIFRRVNSRRTPVPSSFMEDFSPSA